MFESHVIPVGSSFERTKTNQPDEFDINVVLTKLSSMCEVFTTPACPPGFVRLRRKTKQHSTDNDERYFDDDGNIKSDIVRTRFEIILKEILRNTQFWENENFFELDIHSDVDLYNLSPDRVCITLKLAVNEPVNSVPIFHSISVDIVPSLHIEDFWPDDAIQGVSNALKQDGCHLVFYQSHKLHPWLPRNSSYTRISFARAESAVVRRSQQVVKDAFISSKYVTITVEMRTRL